MAIDGNGGQGDMFFEFCPIRSMKEWKIEQIRLSTKIQDGWFLMVTYGDEADRLEEFCGMPK